MPRKTTILIVILAVITGLLVILAIRSDKLLERNFGEDIVTTPTPVTVSPYATLSFSSSFLDFSGAVSTQKVDVIVDTAGKPINAAQIELTYDPNVVSSISVQKPANSLLGNNASILINKIDQKLGRVSYAVVLPINEPERIGLGPVATLNITVNKSVGVEASQITFIDKSAVTSSDTSKSVLKTTYPLKLILKAPSPTSLPL